MKNRQKSQIGIVLDSIFNDYIISKNAENKIQRDRLEASNMTSQLKELCANNIRNLKGTQIEKANTLGWKPELLSYIEYGDRPLTSERLLDIIIKLRPSEKQYKSLIRAYISQNTELKVQTTTRKVSSFYSLQYHRYNQFLETSMSVLALLEILGDKDKKIPDSINIIKVENSMKEIIPELLLAAEGKSSA